MNEATRLVLIGDVGGMETYHVGDEAMLCANIDRLRELHPRPSFTVISRDPASTGAHYGVDAISPIGFPGRSETVSARRTVWDEVSSHLETFLRTGQADRTRRGADAFQVLSASDGLIISGGGNLSSTWPEHLWERAMLIRIADSLGKPVVLTGQTLGPNLDSADRELLQEVLPLARLVSVRERPSATLANSLGVEADRLCYQLDDAFGLRQQPVEDITSRDARATTLRNLDTGEPWIAVTISSFPDFEVPGVLESLAEGLGAVSRANGARLVFVPHVAAPPGGQVCADLELGQRLARLLDPSPGMELLEVRDCRDVAWLTARAALIVSTRYHPLVFGLANQVPCLGIYTNEYTRIKLQGALAHAGLQDWTVPMELCLSGMLEKGASELWSRRQEVRDHLESLESVWRDLEKAGWNRVLRALDLPAGEQGLSPASADCEPGPRPVGAWPQLAEHLWERDRERDRLVSTLETELRARGSRFFYLKKALRLLFRRT